MTSKPVVGGGVVQTHGLVTGLRLCLRPSSSRDALSFTRSLGFNDSQWHSSLGSLVSDGLLTSLESAFSSLDEINASPLTGQCRSLSSLTNFRRRQKAKRLILDLVSHQRSPFVAKALAHRFKSSSLVALSNYRSLAIAAMDNPLLQLTSRRSEMAIRIEGDILKIYLLTLFRHIATSFNSDPLLSISDLLSSLPAELIDFISLCSSWPSVRLRHAIANSLACLLSKLDSKSHCLMLTVTNLILPLRSTSNTVWLHDADFFDDAFLRSAAYVLYSLDPYALSENSLSWACSYVIDQWSHLETSSTSWKSDWLRLRSLPWLHACLVQLLLGSQNQESTFVQFISVIFIVEGDEEKHRLFESYLAGLANQLRPLLLPSTVTLPANRLLAPFRQFATRCSLSAKLGSANQLPPVGQALLCLFIIACPASQSASSAVLESLLSSDMPRPLQRLTAVLEATKILITVASSSYSLASLLDRRYELRMYLRTLASKCIVDDTNGAKPNIESSETLYYRRIDRILMIDE